MNNITNRIADWFGIQDVVENTLEGERIVKSKSSILFEKIKEVAIKAFEVLLHIALFVVNPVLYASGLMTGIVAGDNVEAAIEKIKNVFRNNKWPILAGLGVGALLVPQVTIGIIGTYFAAQLGAQLSKQAAVEPQRIAD